jgi:hypothetical protein
VKQIPCPHCSDGKHMLKVCETCGWPPALNGECMCDHVGELAQLGMRLARVGDIAWQLAQEIQWLDGLEQERVKPLIDELGLIANPPRPKLVAVS